MIDPRIRDLLGADGQPIIPGPPIAPLAKEGLRRLLRRRLGNDLAPAPGNIYFEIHDHPLRNATIDDLESYPWPDLAHPSRFTNLRAEAKTLHDEGQAVLLYTARASFRPPTKCAASSRSLLDLAADPEFVTALLTKIEKLSSDCLRAALREIGEYVESS